MTAITNAIKYLNNWIFSIQYPQLTPALIHSSCIQAAGMDIPALLPVEQSGDSPESGFFPEEVTIHEYGHNIFMDPGQR